jgi:hypothetical protein
MKTILAVLFLSTLALAQGTHTATISGCTDTTPNVSYNLYQGTTSGGESSTPVNASPSATCSFSVTGLLGLTKYYWYTKAFCATCNPNLSAASNEVSGTTLADSGPAAPTGLGVGTISKNGIPLFWTAPQTQGGFTPVAYEIVRGVMPTLPAPQMIAIVPSSTMTSYTDTGCTGKCYYAVRAYVIDGTSKFSTTANSNIVQATMPQ